MAVGCPHPSCLERDTSGGYDLLKSEFFAMTHGQAAFPSFLS